MARIRSIKPEFWTDGAVMDMSPFARLLFLGSWNFSLCDFGHVADDPRRLKMQVLPDDDVMMVRVDGEWTLQPLDPVALVDEIVATGRMDRIELDDRTFLHIRRFIDHQKTERRWTPRCPACRALGDFHDQPPGTSPNLSQTPPPSARERKGKEGMGKAAAATPPQPVDNLPGELAILRSRLDAAGMTARWDKLTDEQVAQIVELVQIHGDTPLVKAAKHAYQPNDPIVFAQGWLNHWAHLSPAGKLTLVKQLCDIHGVELSPSGVCNGCVIDAKVGDR